FVADGVFKTKSELDAANASAKAKGFTAFQEDATGAGDVRFKDLNGDGHITWDGDRQMIGNSIPKSIYGLNINLEYRGFDLMAYFQGTAGSDIFSGVFENTQGGKTTRNQLAYVHNRWKSESDPGNGIVPRAVVGDPNNNNRPSTLMVSSGNFLKLRQLSVGYSLPDYMISKIGMSNLRFYVSSNNLLTFSKFKGFDPEVGGDNLNRGIDNLGYPNPRTIVFGVQMGF
ncbi:MAG: SusC/RagA family TonB-linked outer membrane protein, partial [Mariniphaga sp.]|nr:SusC/RagA family TonB-linked outer membrane protein [Mariniphaga sp.]